MPPPAGPAMGAATGLPVDESTEVYLHSPYAAAKLAGEPDVGADRRNARNGADSPGVGQRRLTLPTGIGRARPRAIEASAIGISTGRPWTASEDGAVARTYTSTSTTSWMRFCALVTLPSKTVGINNIGTWYDGSPSQSCTA